MRSISLHVMAACLLVLAASCGEKSDPSESGTSSKVSFSASPVSLSLPASGGSKSLSLTTDSKSWKASVTGEWVTVSPTSGSGNQEITVTASANNGERRMLTLSFADAGGAKGSTMVSIVQEAGEGSGGQPVVPAPAQFKEKLASTTYQLLLYSFADSDGDGVGDFKGIQYKLDYLDDLGVTALWLSPAHPADSYHGYDVTDYYSINEQYGGEQAFKDLIEAAHHKGIKIYMDYVLNHSGKGNDWFTQALADPSSPYRDYYFISSNPSRDYSSFPMLANTEYKSGEWKQATGGSPKLTITRTTEEVTNGTATWNLYMWDSSGDKSVQFVNKGDGTYYLVMDINGKWGLLVRKYADWSTGSKFGASGDGNLTEGQTINLVAEGKDISFTGSGRYKIELSNVSTETLYYMGCFDTKMPDLNYGDPSKAESNACFQDLAASADKWINLGVDGFRLDAVKHICGGLDSYNNTNNQILLKKWYEHCNATYQAAGHSDNIFMVGEAWDSHNVEKNYYQAITSCFEFAYWSVLYNAVAKQNATNYVSTVTGFINDHKAVRADAETSLFMTNHDHCSQTGDGQARAADDLGKNLAREKQAAAMILTTAGRPFVYQGEELGYWGNAKDRGDEYIRAPILWDKAGKDCAKKGVNEKVDNSMLTSSISVEAQEADANSLLNVYKTWSRLRNTYPALADGTMSAAPGNSSTVATWYMTGTDGSKLLVIHHTGTTKKVLTVSDDMSHPVALLGTASVSGKSLTLGANSSVVFQL